MPSNKKWFETWFNHPFYLELYTHRNDDDAKVLLNLILPDLNLQPNAKILDLGCGNGRHSINLAKLGYDVTGLDLSANLLSIAKQEAERQKIKINFVEADMRYFKLFPPFNAIFSFFTSFGFFDDDRENFSVFRNVSDHLAKDGVYVFDYLNESFIRKNLVAEDVQKKGDFTIILKRWIEKDMVKKTVRIEKKNEILEFEESVKLYPFEMISEVLTNFGLEVTHSWGDYSGIPFSKDAPRIILTAKKI